MESVELKKLQDTEFEILKKLDAFCRKKGIAYSLYAGTLLGAVRHNGFIPWDDDIDIAMTREEYSKFCDAIIKEPIEGLFLENYETDMTCGTCHAKIRKANTLLLQNGENEKRGHHEIWVDIFPLDKVSRNKKTANQTLRIGRQNVLLTRANSRNENDSLGVSAIKTASRIIPDRLRWHKLINNAKKLRELDELIKEDYCWTSMSTIENLLSLRFPDYITNAYTELQFEGTSFYVFHDYDMMLKTLFGDYMQLPPPEDRVCKHSPEKLVF